MTEMGIGEQTDKQILIFGANNIDNFAKILQLS